MKQEKTVVTVSNETHPIRLCRKFEPGYYKIGDPKVENSGECYLIDGKYYRFETGQVVYNFETKVYVLKSENLVEGIVGFNEDTHILGYFTKSPQNVPVHVTGGRLLCLSEDLLKTTQQFRERLSNGEYYHISALEAKRFAQILVPRNEYKHSLPYDSGGVLQTCLNVYEKADVKISNVVEKYAPVLGNLTFGLEFETTAGYVPQRILNQTGLIPLRDGSISGIEYVTVPVSGAKGLQTAINATNELKNRTYFDTSCAMHIHYGNIPRTKEFILAMLKLTCATQNEIYEMFPLYKKYNFGVKNKNYSKPYSEFEFLSRMDTVINSSNIDRNFDILYRYLSMGEPFSARDNDLANVQVHPADPDGRAKWNIRTRYYINNMIPLIFGNKKTVEFRVHTATFEVDKIVPFILLNAMMVNYAIEHTEDILTKPDFLSVEMKGFNLAHIVEEQRKKIKDARARETIYESLVGYIRTRKDYLEDENRRGNIRGNESIIPGARYINWSSTKSDGSDIESDELIFEDLNREVRNRRECETKHQKSKAKIQRDYDEGRFLKSTALRLMQEADHQFLLEKSELVKKGNW